MCIAIVKPVGVDLPSKERLKICFDNNPHSTGFGISLKGVNYNSIMKYSDFDLFYKMAQVFITKSHLAFIHFRYATHGEINLDNCHPFFISDNQKEQCQNRPVLMHNGVFQLGKLKDDKSDTLTLVEKIYSHNLELDNDLITKSNNKIAIMYNDSKYKLYGEWIQDDGCIYSNGSYRKSIVEYQKKFNNNNLTFCDCCGEIGENYLTTEVGYHFCPHCIYNKEIYMYKCFECGKICADKICGNCSEEKNISLKYWK